MSRNATTPPHNLDAEESVLGAMLLSAGAYEKIGEVGLRPDEFYRASHGTIFKVANELHDRGEPVDSITLTAELQRQGKRQDISDDRIHELAALVPSASNAAHYARLIREAAAARALIKAGHDIVRLGMEQPGTTPELIAQAEQALTQATGPSATTRSAAALSDGIDERLAQIREAYQTGVAITGARTGFASLDNLLGGLWPGQLILIAARPGQGKSTLALNIAETFSVRGEAAMFASLEMSREELALRSLARAARINSRVLSSGMLSEDQARKLGEAIPEWKSRKQPLIQDDGAMNVSTIRAEARKLKRQEGITLLVVDYIQLVAVPGMENRTQEIGEISRGLKLLARELEIPVIALSQMSRNIEHRSEKRPVLADLRDSGSLEQDADVVIFIHSDAEYKPDIEPDGTVELIVSKNRRGPTDTVKLAYNRTFSSFGEIANG